MSNLEIPRPSGTKFATIPVFDIGPKGQPAIIVLQEWWGLNENIINKAKRIASAGFRAVVPDFYRGVVAQNANEAGHLMGGLDWAEAVVDMQACVTYLKENGSNKVGCMGFCMGGALSFLAAKNVKGLDCAVPFYGIPPSDSTSLVGITVPVQAHFAIHDDWITKDKVDLAESQLKEGNSPYVFFNYEAHHAFCNDKRPEVFDAVQCQIAFDRVFTFFGQHLF